MADKIIASPNQSIIDTLTAAGRLFVVIMSTAPAAALLVRKHDLVALYDYFHTEPGKALIAAVLGLVSLGYGLYKSYKRGKQVADVAVNPKVPASIADTK